ncbi:MAG: hypothetical protein HYT70_03260 [Candidatus Aenigmarchaeota archaeon]|nr:hypothetical protein [Candidatus Aenigmarchaeota archaeon]
MGDPYKLRQDYNRLADRSRAHYMSREVRADPINSLYSGTGDIGASYDEVRAKARERFSYM